MIAELDRYHGVVLRQIVVGHGKPVSIGIADRSGRVDTFSIEGAAFQIKHSSKRLSPWQFTYLPENLTALSALSDSFRPIWVFWVCGVDGVVGVSFHDLSRIIPRNGDIPESVRVSLSRNSMYRVSGPLGSLRRAVSRGVHPFLKAVASTVPEIDQND